jgi:hypothetical protein
VVVELPVRSAGAKSPIVTTATLPASAQFVGALAQHRIMTIQARGFSQSYLKEVGRYMKVKPCQTCQGNGLCKVCKGRGESYGWMCRVCLGSGNCAKCGGIGEE